MLGGGAGNPPKFDGASGEGIIAHVHLRALAAGTTRLMFLQPLVSLSVNGVVTDGVAPLTKDAQVTVAAAR